jgi:uncharacterized protein
MMRSRLFHVIVSAAILSACASAPTHYYTLLPPADNAAIAHADVAISVDPVSVPPENDQPQWLVRIGRGEVAVLDSERWAAPLGDELRAALSDDLGRLLGTAAPAGSQHVYRVRVQVRRFESMPADHVSIEADWRIERTGTPPLNCASRVSEQVEPGYPAIALGHQRALAEISTQIATAVRGMESGNPACPSS